MSMGQLSAAAAEEYRSGPYAGSELGGPALAALNAERQRQSKRYSKQLDIDTADFCKHCYRLKRQHFVGQCPFDSTTYTPMTIREYMEYVESSRMGRLRIV